MSDIGMCDIECLNMALRAECLTLHPGLAWEQKLAL